MFTLFTLVLGLIGLGFLVFVHELGHYFVARKVGIKVESFSIGFGKPILKWKRDGVEWRIGWLPFGGYVGMAGMEKKGDLQPYEVAGGFYNSKPWSRIKVALAGPLVNILLAFFLFCVIWLGGGREKPFSDFTQRVGYVDPESELFSAGVRPGDIIDSYDGRPVKGKEDQLEAALLSKKPVEIGGYKVDYASGEKTPFHLQISSYLIEGQKSGVRTLGLICPAQYLFVNKTHPFLEGSPLTDTAIQPGDRIFWMDGSLIFSHCQLQSLLSKGKSLLTIDRKGKNLLVRVPRLKIREMHLPKDTRNELSDWHFESEGKGRLAHSFFIPYNIDNRGVVSERLGVTDPDLERVLFPKNPPSIEAPLEAGDRIIAVDGTPVAGGEELFSKLQTHKVSLIVQRHNEGWPVILAKEADAQFDQGINWQALQTLTASLGKNGVRQKGELILLKPIGPITYSELAQQNPDVAKKLEDLEKRIDKVSDLGERAEKMAYLDQIKDQPVLGFNLAERVVRYNPTPFTLFGQVISQVWRTVKSLVVGDLSPKWLSGPLGIVQVVSYGWGIGVTEALFWLGIISLNLGILNLLPIPVLDGGHICFSLWEWVTGKQIKAETRERWMIPFVILLIGFFIFVTYHDISRLVHQVTG